MIDALCAWLNGKRNYSEGVVLYSIHGKDLQLKNLFLKGESPFTTAKLLEELKALYYSKINDDEVPTNSPGEIIPLVKVDEELIEACDTRAMNFYKEMMNKRAILFQLCKTDAWDDENSPDKVTVRGKIAFEILEMKYDVDKAYEDLAYVKQYGRLPDDPIPVQDKYALLPDARVKHEIDNIRKNLNKIKKKAVTPQRLVAIKNHEESLKKLEARWVLLTQKN